MQVLTSPLPVPFAEALAVAREGVVTPEVAGVLIRARAGEEYDSLLSAAAQLRTLIDQQEGASPDLGLRVFVYPGGCSGMSYGMAFEDPPAEDE